jgi:hypothetical protein
MPYSNSNEAIEGAYRQGKITHAQYVMLKKINQEGNKAKHDWK